MKRNWGAALLLLVLLALVGWRLYGTRTAAPGAAEEKAAAGSGGSPSRRGSTGASRGGPGADEIPEVAIHPSAPDRRIAGKVVADGKPVEGAEVRLRARFVSDASGGDVVLRTGPDGHFDFGMRRPTVYVVSGAHSGYSPAITNVDLRGPKRRPPPADELLLTLKACLATAFGQVRDASGGPIAGVELRILEIAGTESGPDGAYELCLGSARQVRVDATGYGSVLLHFGEARGRMKRDIILVPDGSLEGRVVRAAGGEPVPRASVQAFPFEFGQERPAPAQGLTDEKGEFRIAGLQSGRYRIWAQGPSLGMNDSLQVTVVPGETSGGHVLQLSERVTVSGVVKQDGKPLAGVFVQVLGKDVSRSHMVPTQADGSFVATFAHPGPSTVQVTAHRVKSPLEIVAPAKDVVVEVVGMASLRGRILRAGKPVPNAVLQGPGRIGAASDQEGKYVLEGLEPGELKIMAQSAEVGAFTHVTVTMAEGETRELDIELESGAAIAGRIVDEMGRPIAGARVVWTHTTTGDLGFGNTDVDGSFLADSMTGKGQYRPEVFAMIESSAQLPPAEGKHPMIRLDDGNSRVDGVTLRVKNERRTIQGKVIDGTGAPIADARVVALSVKPGADPIFYSWSSLPSAKSDVEGGFTITDLAPGNYAVRAYAPGGSEGTVRDVLAGANRVFVTIARASGIRGKLVGYTRVPPVYVIVADGSNKFFPAQVDGTTFRADSLAPGKYVVAAQTLEEGDAKLVEVQAGAPAEVTLESKGSGTLEGVVTEMSTGAPVVGLPCHTVLRTGGFVAVTNWDENIVPKTDAQGRFVNPRAPAGDVQVTCFNKGDRTNAQGIATLARGGKATVRMKVLARGDAPLTSTGLVIDFMQPEPRVSRVEPGSPAAQAGVRAADLVVSVDGASVEGLGPDGVRTLIAQHPVGKLVLGLSRAGQTLSLTLNVVERE